MASVPQVSGGEKVGNPQEVQLFGAHVLERVEVNRHGGHLVRLQPKLRLDIDISNPAFFFSVTLIILIPRKAKNKIKVHTYISHVVCL